MSMPEIALLLVALLFGVYGWMSSLEVGIGLLRITGRRGADTGTNRNMFTPLWEITNVFLVFGFTGFVVFFNNGLQATSEVVFTVLTLAMVAIVARGCLVLYLYYHRNQLGWTVGNALFVLLSLLVPMCFAAAGIRLLTGAQFWQSNTGWVFAGTALFGILALAVSFMQLVLSRQQKISNRLRLASTGLTVVFAGLGTLGLQTVLTNSTNHLMGAPFVAWTVLIDLLLLFTAVLLLTHKEQRLWWGLSVVAIAAPVVWALANRPYLLYPGLLDTAYGAQAYDKAALIGLAVIFPVILVGFIIFVKLFTTQPKSS